MRIAMLALSRLVQMWCVEQSTPARKRGIGHFVAIALTAAATAGFFMIVYPVARQMMTSTVSAMQQVQQTVLNSTICSSGNCA